MDSRTISPFNTHSFLEAQTSPRCFAESTISTSHDPARWVMGPKARGNSLGKGRRQLAFHKEPPEPSAFPLKPEKTSAGKGGSGALQKGRGKSFFVFPDAGMGGGSVFPNPNKRQASLPVPLGKSRAAPCSVIGAREIPAPFLCPPFFCPGIIFWSYYSKENEARAERALLVIDQNNLLIQSKIKQHKG